jgi:hypothetical protein
MGTHPLSIVTSLQWAVLALATQALSRATTQPETLLQSSQQHRKTQTNPWARHQPRYFWLGEPTQPKIENDNTSGNTARKFAD